jgi:NAD(P)-dependent dehydrogenase (short-subunit alcohol dehydrogenase family)
MSKIFIVTGASRGIGLEVVRFLLEKFGAKVVTLSRSSTAELQALKEKYSDRLEIVRGDVSNEEDQEVSLLSVAHGTCLQHF